MRRNKWTNNQVHHLCLSILGSYSSYLPMCSLAIDIYDANEYRHGITTCRATASSTPTHSLTQINHPSFFTQMTSGTTNLALINGPSNSKHLCDADVTQSSSLVVRWIWVIPHCYSTSRGPATAVSMGEAIGFNHSISLITHRSHKRLKHSLYGTYIIKCVALSLNCLQPKSIGLVPTLAMCNRVVEWRRI